MRCLIWSLIGVALFGAPLAQAQTSSDEEKAVLELESKWFQDKTNNPDLAAPLMAEDYISTWIDGSVLDKAKTLDSDKARKYSSAEGEDVEVTLLGNRAVVTGVYRGAGTKAGEPFEELARFTDTWAKMPEGNWKRVATKYTEVTSDDAVQAIPTGCRTYDGSKYAVKGAIWCVVQRGGLKTGKGKSWGEAHWISSEAPKGYKLRYAEEHVEAKDHHCGVTDDASPPNGEGKREGTAFWATCIIWERDDNHVVVKSNIQGWEGETDWEWSSGNPLKITKHDDREGVGTMTLYTLYVPIAAEKGR
jgi:hypothetical protein